MSDICFSGGESRSGGFGVANLYVQYSIDSGGLLPDRLVYAVITPGLAEQTKGLGGNGFTFVFSGDHSVTVRPRKGETVWIDEQYRAVTLDRTLTAQDIAGLEKLDDREGLEISSPEEFLAIVTRLRSEQAAPIADTAPDAAELSPLSTADRRLPLVDGNHAGAF